MSAGSISVTIAIPSLNGPANGVAAGASNALAVGLLNQVAAAIGGGGATSGNIMRPPGGNPQVVGTWTYSPAT